MYKLFFLSILLFFGTIFSEEVESLPKEEPKTVLVSILPHRYFVNRIAADFVKVEALVPAGTSSHTFEPTPQQMIKAAHAKIWFTMGDAFEDKLKAALLSAKPELQIIDTREGIKLIQESCCHAGCHVHGADPHVWLSPKAAKIQAETIAKALSASFPEKKADFQKGLDGLLADLDALDQEIQDILKDKTPFSVIVSHPAFAYFDRDYNIKQISIETEGREPTPKQLTYLLREIEKLPVNSIFMVPQHANKGASLIAKHLGASLVTIDPYAEDYIKNLLFIAKAFKESIKEPKEDLYQK